MNHLNYLSANNLFVTSTKNTIQGASDASANTMPSMPADDGIIIKMPDASPHQAVALLNSGLRSITQLKISSITPLST